jgi:hypothetical protein
VDASTDTSIWVWYNKPGESQPDEDATYGKQNVWTNNFVGVWYLNETATDEGTTGTHYDSTSNNHDGDQVENENIAGQVGNGQDFDGDDDWIDVGSSIPNLTSATWSAWVKQDTADDYACVIAKWAAGDEGWLFAARSTKIAVETPNDTVYYSTNTMSINTWYHIAATADGSVVRMYKDGSADETTSQSSAINNTGTSTYIGRIPNFAWYYPGIIDEVRLSNAARSAAWINAEYDNQDDPSTFVVEQTAENAETYAGWYDSNWVYRKHIRIDSSRVAGDVEYFPVLINSTDQDWRDTANSGNVAQADGGDILFTSSDGIAKLDHEIESYSPTAGTLIAWVEVPLVSGSSDTAIYMYYGYGSASDQWDASGT